MFTTILVPVDGSAPAGEALKLAAKLARSASATVKVVSIPQQILPPAEEDLAWDSRGEVLGAVADMHTRRAQRVLDAAAAELDGSGIRFSTAIIEAEEPYEGILEAAEQVGADLIVMGSHGRRGIHRLLLGSQAAKVIALSRVPVLVCKAAED